MIDFAFGVLAAIVLLPLIAAAWSAAKVKIEPEAEPDLIVGGDTDHPRDQRTCG